MELDGLNKEELVTLIKKLGERYNNLLEWIDNWDPNFCEDNYWQNEDAILHKKMKKELKKLRVLEG